MQWIRPGRHRGFLIFLGAIAGFFFAGVFLSTQGPDAGIALPFYGPIFAVPIILLLLWTEKMSFNQPDGQSVKTPAKFFWILLLSIVTALLFFLWLIWLPK
ncbi:MAG: hypothetical protein Q7R60_02630 [bacterium]|nr:hypothetical protein [bacterium]